jgi:hypothetical protein
MKKQRRNDALVDMWSLVHLVTCGAMAWVLGPWVAIVIATLWEPLEIFVLSPLLAKRGIVFGHEAWQNSLSDVAFNLLGIGIAMLIKNL